LTDDQLFGVIASVAVLVFLLGRGGMVRNPQQRRYAQLAALGIVLAAILYAGFRSLAWFLR
jgi:hypothetical protein